MCLLFSRSCLRYPPTTHPGLVKQTYSALVSLPVSSDPRAPPVVRKWHLTAYLEQGSLPDLLTVDTDPILRDIVLPQGMYRSGKSRQRQTTQEGSGGLRWISMDGSNGQSVPPRTSSSSEASTSSSPSHSPTISSASSLQPSPNVSPKILQQSFPRRSAQYANPSRPSVPEAYLVSSPVPSQYPPQSSTILPPFQAAFSLPQPSPLPQAEMSRPRMTRRTSGDRSPEDARVIGLLNSRSAFS